MFAHGEKNKDTNISILLLNKNPIINLEGVKPNTFQSIILNVKKSMIINGLTIMSLHLLQKQFVIILNF